VSFLAALRALLSHWTYRPAQFFALLLGLSLATGLWTGIQAINTEARNAYATASSSLLPNFPSSLQRKDSAPIALRTYVALQLAGWRTSPLLEGEMVLAGRKFAVTGLDPVSLPRLETGHLQPPGDDGLAQFLTPPYAIMATPDTARLLQQEPELPPLIENADLPDDALVMDIGLASKFLKMPDQISRLLLEPSQNANRGSLAVIAPQLEVVTHQPQADISRLTDSFHLNLTAFGLLAFAVGLFIVQGTIALAFEQRRLLFRTLRVLGVSARMLFAVQMLELLIFAVVAGCIGIILGYFVAALLLPDVAATLRGLYGAEVTGDLQFRTQWWLSGLLIAVLGTVLAASASLYRLIKMPILAAAMPRAWAVVSNRTTRWQWGSAILLFLVALALHQFGSGLVIAFLQVALVLLGAALLLPGLFFQIIRGLQSLARGPLSSWFWADTRQQLPGLSLALMALLLALAANIGVSTMVGSFRTTFSGWLDQRLAAELYVRARDEEQASAMRNWLHSRVEAVLPVWRVEERLNGEPGKLFGFSDHATYRDNWPMLQIADRGWDRVAAGQGLLINEQMARRQGLNLGDTVSLQTGRTLPVAGIYPDYGNPNPQALISTELLELWYPRVERLQYALRVKPERVDEIASSLRTEFDLSGTNLVDQASLKQRSFTVFERTFAVTEALNIMTLAVAGFAIFTSLLTLTRMRLPQLAPVWAMGLTRRQLAGLELLRALILAAMTMVFALPLGLVLAWLLLAVVNVEAFGWRLPMFLFYADWVRLSLYGLIATGLAAAIPARHMARTEPAELVKVFAHER